MDKNQDIIDLLKSTPAIEPPASFTDNIMRRLPDRYPDILLAAGSYIYQLYNLALEPDGDPASGLTRREFSFYFFITGFFYLIIGIILTIGLQGISTGIVAMEWIKLQPFLCLASALMFGFCGVVLYTGVNRGLKLVWSYVLFHIGFAVLNGIFLGLSAAVPLTIMFTVLFATPVIIMASAFFMNNDKTRKFLTQGEIFSHAVQ